MSPLTVFGNFRIDSDERLVRFMDSFFSFNKSNIDKWIINIRGPLKDKASNFLSTELGNKVSIFEIDSRRGWLHDSLYLVRYIKSPYVMVWVEDHVCMCGPEKFDAIINEVALLKIDYIGYSWFGNGLFHKEFSGIEKFKGDTISVINYDLNANKVRQKNSLNLINSESYIVSLCGLFSKQFFIKILKAKKPYLLRWPIYTPFNFEKSSKDIYILPIKYGVSHIEIFSSIDDDNKHPNSCLVARGLYPNRVSREQMVDFRENSSSYYHLPFIPFMKKIRFLVGIYELYKRITYTFKQ
jgi:hypothetical protein